MRLSQADLALAVPRPAPGGELRYCCPLCQDRKYHLYANPGKGLWHCFRCGAAGTWGEKGRGLTRQGRASRPSQELVRRAPDEVLDRAYREMLNGLPLCDSHLMHLLMERHMTPTQIALGHYRTLPQGDMAREPAVRAVLQAVGEPVGVPGFYRNREGNWAVAGSPGLLVPVRSWTGSILGIQIRRPRGTPRYVWLSSRVLADGETPAPDGTPARAVYHVAWPPPPARPSRRVWVTEGALKGDVSAALLGEVVVAVPGIHTWRGSGVVSGILAAAHQDMRVLGVREVVLAYDADMKTNVHVRQAAERLVRAMRRAGLQVTVAVWPLEAGKGLDDLLLAGHSPKLVTAAEWLNQLRRTGAAPNGPGRGGRGRDSRRAG